MLTWIKVSKSALKYNLNQYRKILQPQTKILSVVKSNAYGHGYEIAKFISPLTDWFGVVNLDEAFLLRGRNIHKPILVLSYFEWKSNKLLIALKEKIRLPIYSLDTAKKLNRLAQKYRQKFKIHFKIDTGTSRLGLTELEAINTIKQLKKLKFIEIEGIFSHLAASEELKSYTQLQYHRFVAIIRKITNLGFNIPYHHLACSAAVLVKLESQFDLIRLGISLYGLWPSNQTRKITQKKYPRFNLKPALSWKTKIIQIKIVPKGTPIGYGCSYKIKRQTKLGILPIGYNEGYDRRLSNKGEVLVKGQRSKVLGRICMNLTMIDLTDIPNVRVGETVILIGCNGKQEITADDLAKKIGTINYEVVTRINPDLPRIYY